MNPLGGTLLFPIYHLSCSSSIYATAFTACSRPWRERAASAVEGCLRRIVWRSEKLEKRIFHLFSRLYHDLSQLMINFAKIKVTDRP